MSTVNIGIFGRRNVGKSSIINAMTGQEVAIVSDRPGTTTDPVRKRLEIFGLGPCVLIDTAGIDDEGELGQKRVAGTEAVVAQIDVAVLVFAGDDFGEPEDRLMRQFRRYSLPVVLVHNKSDKAALTGSTADRLSAEYSLPVLEFSARTAGSGTGVAELTDRIRQVVKNSAFSAERPMFEGLVEEGQHVLLVCPIDSEAPTGRLILPQVNAIRNLLDIGAVVTVAQPDRIGQVLSCSRNGFDLVVTDSQAFGEVAEAVPGEIPLTSFSMLLARSKGCFKEYCEGTPRISSLKDGDRILILESCTHHASCDDIGRVRIPALMRKFTGKTLAFDVVGGLDTVERPVKEYALVLQCGGCMITRRQLFSRLLPAIESGVPVTNYGMAISYMKGIYDRALKPLLK
ncbi:MAG TPA: [FeFe] hydrogenase H-cluster maturation GTPase HydF [Candidatus Coprenecus stercoravium]|uniref:[FeFe] hydrogenase H-cluster maturation GTPase HydF n=1 Tax=Candidatus Coprenecus stercoravium TaxID=2840735 RepID=A0A9D2K9G1_9BACT|nr:[FeFe] hydrogenase H-cluster maturation GTPase HydF [Candidatus Coprenecus stercoravium]